MDVALALHISKKGGRLRPRTDSCGHTLGIIAAEWRNGEIGRRSGLKSRSGANRVWIRFPLPPPFRRRCQPQGPLRSGPLSVEITTSGSFSQGILIGFWQWPSSLSQCRRALIDLAQVSIMIGLTSRASMSSIAVLKTDMFWDSGTAPASTPSNAFHDCQYHPSARFETPLV